MAQYLSKQQFGSEIGSEARSAEVELDQTYANSGELDQLIERNYALIISSLLPELLHEANNELAVLQGSGELLALAKKVPELEKLERRGQTIVKASHRLAGLCRLLERNPSGALNATSYELTRVFQAVHGEITMLNSFDTIQWILEQSDPLSIECPAWVVKQVILNLLSRSLVQLTGKTNEKKILTQFTSSETEVSFHWQENGEGADTSMIRRRSGFNLSGQTPPVFNLTLCELLLARYQGRIVLPEDAPGLITVTFPRVSQL